MRASALQTLSLSGGFCACFCLPDDADWLQLEQAKTRPLFAPERERGVLLSASFECI